MKTAAKISILAIGYLILSTMCLVLLAFVPAAREIDPDGTLHFRPWIMIPVIIIPSLILLFLYYLEIPRKSGDSVSFPKLLDRWCQSSLKVSSGITAAGISYRIRKERQSETSYRILAILSFLFFFPLVPVFCIMAARCQDAQRKLFRFSTQQHSAPTPAAPVPSAPPAAPQPEEKPSVSQQNEVAAVPFYRQKSFWAVAAVVLILSILFSPSPEDPHAPSVPSTTASSVDSDAFVALVSAAIQGAINTSEESITGVSLEGNNLCVYVDLSNADPSPLTLEELALSRTGSITDSILSIGVHDDMWDTITVDFGSIGKVVNAKEDVEENEYGRYFPSVGFELECTESSEPPHPNTAPVATETQPENTKLPAAPTDPTEEMVWIPTIAGIKYHCGPNCSDMIDPEYVTVSEAIERGFTRCKKCYR